MRGLLYDKDTRLSESRERILFPGNLRGLDVKTMLVSPAGTELEWNTFHPILTHSTQTGCHVDVWTSWRIPH